MVAETGTVGTGDLPRWREHFLEVGYTGDRVVELLGPVAHDALARLETVPARRATRGGSALETLVRLFLLQLPVPVAEAERALPSGAVDVLVETSAGEARAVLDVRPYADCYYVVSDIGSGLDRNVRPLPPDHVLGVGGASTTLAQLTVRTPVSRAADIGTGSGVQALHLAEHSDTVVATDVLPRALELARLTAGLSGVRLDLRQGDLLEPLGDEPVDLLVSNPPFVVGAPGRHTYRDSGRPGDQVCAQLVRQAPRHLTEGGWCQLLANWVHPAGGDWREHVAQWVPEGVDAWVVQREVQDPAQYVSLWLHDSGDVTDSYLESYDAWLDGLERTGVEGVGFGWVVLRRTDGPANVRIEDWPHPVEQPLGPAVLERARRVDWLRGRDTDALLASRLTVAPDVVQETVGQPGAEDPEHVVLRQQRGMRRAERVDSATAALVGACEGSLPLGALVAAVAEVLDADVATLRGELVPVVRRLVEDGFLLPPA